MDQKILLIDDNVQDLKAMTIVLERAGYKDVLLAETAQRGLTVAGEKPMDIIFIDVVLDQGIDGFDICVRLRQQGCGAKIIMVTGHLDAVNAKKARTSGADEIIQKTPVFHNLVGAIQSVWKIKK
jgi:two-component system, cell cycle sensor histidine kinase and response regulator CckA